MATQQFWHRLAGHDLALRAADADREWAAERLRAAHAEGRLDVGEFQERLERCYRAKTFGDLAELVGDLPRQDDRELQRPSGPLVPWRLGVLIPVLIGLLFVSAAVAHHAFWLWAALLFIAWRMGWSPRRRRWSSASRRGPGDWT